MTAVGFPPPDPNDRQVWAKTISPGDVMWMFRLWNIWGSTGCAEGRPVLAEALDAWSRQVRYR